MAYTLTAQDGRTAYAGPNAIAVVIKRLKLTKRDAMFTLLDDGGELLPRHVQLMNSAIRDGGYDKNLPERFTELVSALADEQVGAALRYQPGLTGLKAHTQL